MTIKSIQCRLMALAEETGYRDLNPGDIDGILGSKTRSAVKAFQQAYGLNADGYPGDQTCAALKHASCYGLDVPDSSQDDNLHDSAEDAGNGAEKYLQADGYYHIPRGVNVQLSKNLWADEIHCQGVGCCTESKISKQIVDLFQEIRDDIGEPLEIGSAGGSGYRCERHNAEIPGASATSLHLKSDAVDIHYKDPSALKACVKRHLTSGEIGKYSWGCHVGVWDRGYINEFNGN